MCPPYLACSEVTGIGNAGDLPLAVITAVDLSLSAADNRRMRFQLLNLLVQGIEPVLPDAAKRIGHLGQIAAGVVVVGGDCRCRERGGYTLGICFAWARKACAHPTRLHGYPA